MYYERATGSFGRGEGEGGEVISRTVTSNGFQFLTVIIMHVCRLSMETRT